MLTAGRRAVVLVGGPVAPYSRAIRIARALAAEGFGVEIAAIATAGLPDREAVAGPAPGSTGQPEPEPTSIGRIEIHRYRPSGMWAWIGASDAAGTGGAPPDGTGVARRRGPRRRLLGLVRPVARPALALRRWLLWPHTVRGWWATLARDLEPADLYHACGTLTIAAALEARQRSARGPSGLRPGVIYDAIDDAAESNQAMAMPGPIRRRHARTEAGWARAADAVVTVNEALAKRLAARWRLANLPLVVPNLPEPLPPSALANRPDHLRVAARLPRATRVVLFHGRLGGGRGLDAAAEAVLAIPDAALVLMGFGPGADAALARDRDPRFAGRHATLPARHPDEVVAWVASADVAILPLPLLSMNQRLASPSKFWEALAAGTPVVVVAGLEVMERLVRDHDLGAVAISGEPADLVPAIRTVLDRLAIEGEAWRARIARTSAERFGWPPVASRYRALARDVSGR